MRILVTGARGMLGSVLLPLLAGEHEVAGVDYQDFDISAADSVQKAFREFRPQFVFHLAACTDVDGCETNPRLAWEVNAQGTRNVARSCAETGGTLLAVSTDYVFDGRRERPCREDDVPNPLSAYGKSKLRGEQHVQSLLPRHFIVRSSWLFGPHGKNFVRTILKLAGERDELRVVGDQRGSPTYTRHLASKLVEFLHFEAYGIYHATGAGSCSWFEFAQTIVHEGGFGGVRVLPISTRQAGRLAPRPANSELENGRLADIKSAALPHWKVGLAEYLRECRDSGEINLPAFDHREQQLHSEGTR